MCPSSLPRNHGRKWARSRMLCSWKAWCGKGHGTCFTTEVRILTSAWGKRRLRNKPEGGGELPTGLTAEGNSIRPSFSRHFLPGFGARDCFIPALSHLIYLRVGHAWFKPAFLPWQVGNCLHFLPEARAQTG